MWSLNGVKRQKHPEQCVAPCDLLMSAIFIVDILRLEHDLAGVSPPLTLLINFGAFFLHVTIDKIYPLTWEHRYSVF